jgi:hypothetical protein
MAKIDVVISSLVVASVPSDRVRWPVACLLVTGSGSVPPASPGAVHTGQSDCTHRLHVYESINERVHSQRPDWPATNSSDWLHTSSPRRCPTHAPPHHCRHLRGLAKARASMHCSPSWPTSTALPYAVPPTRSPAHGVHTYTPIYV